MHGIVAALVLMHNTMFFGKFLASKNQPALVLLPAKMILQIISDGFLVTLLGSIAASLTTGSFLPQIIKGYRTKKMQDVSPYLMILFASGTTLWLAYGIFKDDWVIIVANALGTAFNLVLLFMKWIYTCTNGEDGYF